MVTMRTDKAIQALEELKEEASGAGVTSGGEHFVAWQGKARGVLVAALGKDDHLVDRFDNISYSLGFWSSSTPASAFHDKRRSGIRNACGVIDAALYQLRLQIDDDEPVDLRSFDPELWANVKQLVEDEDWSKVASQTAIFVEDRIRSWAGDPQGTKSEPLVGKGLMASVFSVSRLVNVR